MSIVFPDIYLTDSIMFQYEIYFRCKFVKFFLRSAQHRLHGRVAKGEGHLGHDEAVEAGGREFDPRPGHYSRMIF